MPLFTQRTELYSSFFTEAVLADIRGRIAERFVRAFGVRAIAPDETISGMMATVYDKNKRTVSEMVDEVAEVVFRAYETEYLATDRANSLDAIRASTWDFELPMRQHDTVKKIRARQMVWAYAT